MDEERLIQLAQGGDLPAFNKLVLSYQGLVYNVTYRILGDREMANDAAQDTFLKAYSRLHQYRGGSFRGWLLRIATNVCYDMLRRRRNRVTVALDTDDEVRRDDKLVSSRDSLFDHVARRELMQSLQRAIVTLPPDQRAVLVLADIEGVEYREIAEITGAALGTIKSRLSRARCRLRDVLVSEKVLPPAHLSGNQRSFGGGAG